MLRSLALSVLALAVLASPAHAAVGDISTVAGTGTAGFNGDNVAATTAQLTTPVQAIPARGGGFLIADQVNFRVRQVAPDGTITTLAGTGVQSSTGDGGPATSATLAAPSGLAYLSDGSLLIAEANGNRIRKIDAATGKISTVVGTGGAGFAGDNGPATAAQIRFPYDIGVFSDNSYVIADTDNNRVRYVSATGTITTFGSTGTAGALTKPSSVAVLPDSSVLVADTDGHRVRRAYANGTITTVAGNGVAGYTGDGGPATNARMNRPSRIAVQPDGGYLIADRNNSVVRRVDPSGTITTIAGTGTAGAAGDGGPAAAAQLNQAVGVSVMPNGDVLVTDTFNQRIRLIDQSEDATPPPAVEPPPPPVIPVPPVERNVLPPTISSAYLTDTNPLYLCAKGTWEGLADNPQFSYEWFKIVETPWDPATRSASVSISKVGSGNTYRLTDDDRGKRFSCQVTATTATGNRITGYGKSAVLSGVPKIDPFLIPKTYGDVRVSGIDVFQMSQPSAGSQRFEVGTPNFPALCSGGTPTSFHPRLGTCGLATLDATGPQRTVYQGVPVDGGQPATAIVYVTMATGTAGDKDQVVNVALRGRLNGKLITNGGTPTAQIKEPPTQQDPTGVTSDEREKIGVRIQIPNSWLQAAGATENRFDLEASVSLAPSPANLVQCEVTVFSTTSCYANDSYRLDGVGVWTDLAHMYISPLALIDNNQKQTKASFQDPGDRTKVLRDLLPGGRQITVGPWRGEMDITGAVELTAQAEICVKLKVDLRTCRQNAIETRLASYIARERDGAYDLIMGVHRYASGLGYTEPGWQNSNNEVGEPGAHFTINDGSDKRQITLVAHEYIHAFRVLHADTAAPEPLTGKKCGGGVGGYGEPWPPDNFGRLQGAAFGRYDASGNRTDTVNVDKSTADGALFDLMSYCAKESNAWLGPYNWTRVFDGLRNYKSKVGGRSVASAAAAGPRGRAAVTGQGYVVGSVTPSGIEISQVVPADPGNVVPAPDPGSGVQVNALGASGQPVGTVPASLGVLSDSDTPVQTFIAPLPAGAAAVTATSGANTDRVERSKPPTVKLVAPRAGTRVGGSAKDRLDVRWTAKDPEGDPLDVTVDYAADGKTFKPVFQGPSRGSASIPGDLLAASRKGRVRVTVYDGFNQARAVSGAIVADGGAPSATITTPAARDKLSAGGQSVLTGQGVDGAGRKLTGRSLTWFAGSKRLGTGEVLRATLPAGAVRLRLVARAGGRVATASRTVRVAAVPLLVSRADAPARVTAKAKTVAVTVATTTPATLKIGGKSYAVGPKAKKLTVALPAKPATGVLKLALTVTARGSKPQRATVAVLRL